MSVRGTLKMPSRNERAFWDRFPELLLDDKEDIHNDLIGNLRNMSISHWKGKIGINMKRLEFYLIILCAELGFIIGAMFAIPLGII